MKDPGQLLVFVGKAGNVGRQVELDDQPFAGFDGGVLCFVETVGGDAHDIKGLHLVGDTFDKMHGAGAKGDKQFIKPVEMLKLHPFTPAGNPVLVVEPTLDEDIFLETSIGRENTGTLSKVRSTSGNAPAVFCGASSGF